MLRKEMCESIFDLKNTINHFLNNSNIDGLKEMVLFITESKEYRKLWERDNQLYMLNQFCYIWRTEKIELLERGIQEDIFWNVHSLEDVEYKYNLIKYTLLRLENNCPYELFENCLNELIENGISGVAIGVVAEAETKDIRNNIIRTAQELEHKNMINMAVMLLNYGISKEIIE